MKEELNEKMHGEFTVDSEVEVKLLAFTAIEAMRELGYTEAEVSSMYNISTDIIQKHIAEYDSLNVED